MNQSRKMSLVIHGFFWERYFTVTDSMFKFSKVLLLFQSSQMAVWDPDALAAAKSIAFSFEVLKLAAFFSEIKANVFLHIVLKIKPVLSQLYICSGVKPSFFYNIQKFAFEPFHLSWVSGKFLTTIADLSNSMHFFQRSNHPRLAVKFWSPLALLSG